MFVVAEPGAFDAFVLYHQGLAKKSSKMLVRWVGMEPEDAEQVAMLGLLKAARRFDPDRGYQFSTLAGYHILSTCQRHAVDCGLLVRIPHHRFWPCYKVQFQVTKLITTYGPVEARDAIRQLSAPPRTEQSAMTSSSWRSCRVALPVRGSVIFSKRVKTWFRRIDILRRAPEKSASGTHAA